MIKKRELLIPICYLKMLRAWGKNSFELLFYYILCPLYSDPFSCSNLFRIRPFHRRKYLWDIGTSFVTSNVFYFFYACCFPLILGTSGVLGILQLSHVYKAFLSFQIFLSHYCISAHIHFCVVRYQVLLMPF